MYISTTLSVENNDVHDMNSTYLIILTILLLSPHALISGTSNDSIPDVHFVVVRVDLLFFVVEGFYEFSQPFRKSLPDKGFLERGDILYQQAPAGDFVQTRKMVLLK